MIVANMGHDTDKKTKDMLAFEESQNELDLPPQWKEMVEKKKAIVNNQETATKSKKKMLPKKQQKPKKKEGKKHHFFHKKSTTEGFNVSQL